MKRKSTQQKIREQRLRNKRYYKNIKTRRSQKVILEVIGIENLPIDYQQVATIIKQDKIIHVR